MRTIIKLPFVTAMLIGTVLTAQESTGSLVGTVRTQAGEVAQGVRVVIAGEAILGSRTTVTDANGNYRFQILPPGDYTLTVSKEGFIGSRATFRVNVGQTSRQNMNLREISVGVAEVVVAAGEAVQVDKTDTKTVTNMSADRLMELPVTMAGRAVITSRLIPGVFGDGTPAFRGSPAGSAQYYIDGVNVRDPVERVGQDYRRILVDLVDSVQVVQSPLNSKYGHTSGGLTNVVTKSGTNDFSGSFRTTLTRPEWSTARNIPARWSRFNRTAPYNQPAKTMISNVPSVTHDDLSRDYQATLRGPIIKDHLTFSYGRQWFPVTTASNLSANNPYPNYGYYITALQGASTAIRSFDFGFPDDQQSRRLYGKGNTDVLDQFRLYFILNPNHQIEAYYTLAEQDAFQPLATLEPNMGDRYTASRKMFGFDYTGVLFNGVLNVKWGRADSETGLPSGPGDPISVASWNSNATSIENYSQTTRSSLSLNGSYGSPHPGLRQTDTYSLNYSRTIGSHNIDLGFARLLETGMAATYTGVNNRMFASPGMTENQEFMVYNWFLSPFAAPGYNNLTVYNAMIAPGNTLVPNFYSYEMLPGLDYHTYDISDSIYINDMWHINDNWSVMAGLRYDNWKNENYKGKELDTGAISPRLEVKYDLRGDNRQLLSLSYAHFRGTIALPRQGHSYSRQATDMRIMKNWSRGDAGVMYSVPRTVLLDESNYSVLRRIDSSFGYYINPDIKPEVSKQVEFAYRRSFEKGGFMRASVVHRKYEDTLYARGTTEVVWDTADTINPASRLVSYLDTDPHNNRSYYGLELEWELPLYSSATSRVTANGAWTSARSRGRDTWMADGSLSPLRFDDLYAANGFYLDDYNSYGEYGYGRHNVFTLWCTWNYGAPGKVRSTIAVMGNYASGGPGDLTFTEYLPGMNPAYPGAALFPSTGNTPTTINHYIGKRGQFIGQDNYTVNLRWSLSIPIPARLAAFKNLAAFTELTINNLFNDILPSGYARTNDSTVRSRASADYNTNYATARNNPNAMSEYGVPQYSGTLASNMPHARTYDFSVGIRF